MGERCNCVDSYGRPMSPGLHEVDIRLLTKREKGKDSALTRFIKKVKIDPSKIWYPTYWRKPDVKYAHIDQLKDEFLKLVSEDL